MKNLIEIGFDLTQREEIISLLRNLEQRIAAGVLPALTPEQRRS